MRLGIRESGGQAATFLHALPLQCSIARSRTEVPVAVGRAKDEDDVGGDLWAHPSNEKNEVGTASYVSHCFLHAASAFTYKCRGAKNHGERKMTVK